MPVDSDKPLTLKQQKFIAAYVDLEGNGTKAAIAAGYSPNAHPAKTASENVRKPQIRFQIERLLSKHRMVKRSFRRVSQALDAEKTIVAGDQVYKEPDHGPRLRAAELTFKLARILEPIEQKPANQVNVQIVNAAPETVLELIAVLGRALKPAEQALATSDKGSALVAWVSASRRWPTEDELARLENVTPQPVVVDGKKD